MGIRLTALQWSVFPFWDFYKQSLCLQWNNVWLYITAAWALWEYNAVPEAEAENFYIFMHKNTDRRIHEIHQVYPVCIYIYTHTEIDYMLMFMHTYLYKAKVLNEQVKMLLATKVEFNYCNIHPSKNGVKSTRCAPPEDSSAHPMAAVCARWDLPCRCSCPSPSNIWELL